MTATLPHTNTVFRAFADPCRLRILNLLVEREMCVCELTVVLRLPQPTISRHLAYLRRAGLVRGHRKGKWKHYSVPSSPTGLEKTLLDCVGSCLREVAVLRRDLARARAKAPGAECGT